MNAKEIYDKLKAIKYDIDSIDTVLARGNHALSPQAFDVAANETNAVILDTRDPEIFAKGFLPNSINIGIDGSFAPWVGTLITDIKQPILLVADEGREEEVVTRLARVGYDYCIGYLAGGFDVWKNAGNEIDTIESINAETLFNIGSENEISIVDVRKKSEFDSEHIIDAENLPLDFINQNFTSIDKNITHYIHCAGGYRSMIFISILKARGYNNLINVAGGFKSIKEQGKFQITEYVCPSTLL
jgi:rhodanese-related sulfurtransferase